MALWNIYQELNIQNLRGGAQLDRTMNASQHSEQRERTADVDERVDRLLLLTEAMWEILEQRLGMTEEDLAKMVATIDQRDGHLDSRAVRPVRRCEPCGAAVPKDRTTCLFCGAPSPGASMFGAV